MRSAKNTAAWARLGIVDLPAQLDQRSVGRQHDVDLSHVRFVRPGDQHCAALGQGVRRSGLGAGEGVDIGEQDDLQRGVAGR